MITTDLPAGPLRSGPARLSRERSRGRKIGPRATATGSPVLS